jgi:hypothetical protein
MFKFAKYTAVILAAMGLPLGRITADDDEVVPAAEVAAGPQVRENFDGVFDQWLFNGVNNAATGRQKIEAQITLQIAELDRVCQLTEPQKQRLQLAARGDVQRFWEEVETLRLKFNAVKNDQEAVNNMWQEIQPLQQKQARGLTGPGSLLTKTVTTTLTTNQTEQYEALQAARRIFRYEASIAVALTTLEGSVPLTHQQRDALSKLLLEETPPRRFGQYDNYLINYRLANIPASKLQPLFDKRQWEGLTQQFNQYRGMRDFLIQQGMFAPEDLAIANQPAAAPPPREVQP